MTRTVTAFKGKRMVLLGGGEDVANWLLDHGAHITVTASPLVRRLQAYARTVATDGAVYERRKRAIVHASEEQLVSGVSEADAVVASPAMLAKHPVVLCAHERGIPVIESGHVRAMTALPTRQRIIHESSTRTVVDDSGAWVPARSICTLRQWGGPNTILITGGDEKCDYTAWADEVHHSISKNNIIFLAGTAVPRMRKALGSYARGIRMYESFAGACRAARLRAEKFVSSKVVLSPAAQQQAEIAEQFAKLLRP